MPASPSPPRAYCLCCGGIENARLLLNFTSQVPAGIGNQNDLVGRYFNDHPGTPPPLGEVILTDAPAARCSSSPRPRRPSPSSAPCR